VHVGCNSTTCSLVRPCLRCLRPSPVLASTTSSPLRPSSACAAWPAGPRRQLAACHSRAAGRAAEPRSLFGGAGSAVATSVPRRPYLSAHRVAPPNWSFNRSANGWPPCPRGAVCLSCTSRARRPAAVARLTLR
jgi:hypothetical protein